MLKLSQAKLDSMREHPFPWTPTCNLSLGLKLKWNASRFSPDRALFPPRWKVWEVVYDASNNNLDVVLHEVELTGCNCGGI
jgi:hypothetical protein